MELDSVPVSVLMECVADTAASFNISLQDMLRALEEEYPGIIERWNSYTTNISHLPDELVLESMQSMSVQQISTLSRLNQRMYDIAHDPIFWRQRIQQDWGEQYEGDDPFAQYGELYRNYILWSDIPQIVQDLKQTFLEQVPDSPASYRLVRDVPQETYYSYRAESGKSYGRYSPHTLFLHNADGVLSVTEEELPRDKGTFVGVWFQVFYESFCDRNRAWSVRFWYKWYISKLAIAKLYSIYSPTKYRVSTVIQDYSVQQYAEIGIAVEVRRGRARLTKWAIPQDRIPELARHIQDTILSKLAHNEDGDALKALVLERQYLLLQDKGDNYIGIYTEAGGLRITQGAPISRISYIVPYRYKIEGGRTKAEAKKLQTCKPRTGPVFSRPGAPLGMGPIAFSQKLSGWLQKGYTAYYSRKDRVKWTAHSSQLDTDDHGVMGACIYATMRLWKRI